MKPLSAWVMIEVIGDQPEINLTYWGLTEQQAITALVKVKKKPWTALVDHGFIPLEIEIRLASRLKKKTRPILQGSVMTPEMEEVMTKAKQRLATVKTAALTVVSVLIISIISVYQALADTRFATTSFGTGFCIERPWSCGSIEVVRETIRHPVLHRFNGPARHPISSSHVAGRDQLIPALAAKVSQIIATCGSHLVSGFRPHAHVAGTNHPSLHSTYPARAADMSGNPSCIYSMLHDWPGGYSTDYYRVRHVHLSYSPPGSGYLAGREWGRHFVHGGGGHHHRYAHVRRHQHARG